MRGFLCLKSSARSTHVLMKNRLFVRRVRQPGRSSFHFFLHSIMTSGAFPTANRESAFTLSTSQTRPQPLHTPTRQWDLFCPPMVSGEPTDPILPDSDPFLPKGHPPPPHPRAAEQTSLIVAI